MPSATVRRYSSAARLEAAYLAAKVELTPTQHRPCEARVVHLQFDHLSMRRVDELAHRIKWAAQSPQRTCATLPTRPGPSPLVDAVTDIATRFGSWHFGRFTSCDRLIFGEPPSVTLQGAGRR